MEHFFSKMLAFVFAAALCLGLACLSIERVSFNAEYHKELVDRKYISSELNMNDEQIDSVLTTIARYISGKEKSMQYELKGGKQLFNKRELEHMEDVQKLFKTCRYVKYSCFAACAVLFVLLIMINGKYAFHYIARGCTLFLIIAAIAIVGLALWYFIDFESFWTAFHKVVFKNDLWLMQSGDAIIIIYSLEFFMAVVKRIILRIAYAFGVILLLAVFGWAFLPKERKGFPIIG